MQILVNLSICLAQRVNTESSAAISRVLSLFFFSVSLLLVRRDVLGAAPSASRSDGINKRRWGIRSTFPQGQWGPAIGGVPCPNRHLHVKSWTALHP